MVALALALALRFDCLRQALENLHDSPQILGFKILFIQLQKVDIDLILFVCPFSP
jgi:hypothetical protein